jgi:hypothetical protein
MNPAEETNDMARSSCRKFTLLDAMILVGGVAIGFAGCRTEIVEFGFPDERRLAAIHRLSGKFLMLASILVLAWRLRRPRPSIRRIGRQPGAAACLSIIMFDLFYSVHYLISDALEGQYIWKPGYHYGRLLWFTLLSFEYECGHVVAVVWIIFALGRIGRPEAGWIDRSGRIVGWLWIAWGIGGAFL